LAKAALNFLLITMVDLDTIWHWDTMFLAFPGMSTTNRTLIYSAGCITDRLAGTGIIMYLMQPDNNVFMALLHVFVTQMKLCMKMVTRLSLQIRICC